MPSLDENENETENETAVAVETAPEVAPETGTVTATGIPDTVGGSRALALLLVVTGAAGLLAAWVITIDKFKLLVDPGFTPGC
ncbi:hypothetical protein ACWEJP_27705, partial [Streptomyces sp. NPDC004749]